MAESGDQTIFISYARNDIERVMPIYAELNALGFKLWFDQENLLPGQLWEEEVKTALSSARVILLCVSSEWVQRRSYVYKELRLALDIVQELPSDQVFVFPVRLDDCEMPPELSELHWMDLWTDVHMEKLVDVLTKMIRGKSDDFYVQYPVLLGTDSVRAATHTIVDQCFDLVLLSQSNEKVNQTIADGKEHSYMNYWTTGSESLTTIIHVHPGDPATVAPTLRGIVNSRFQIAGAFLKESAGLMMLDYFVQKLPSGSMQPTRISLALSFFPLDTSALPECLHACIIHPEILTDEEFKSISNMASES